MGGEFPLASNPSIALHFITACNLNPQDLANLEMTCSFFRQPANFEPDLNLSIVELAAFDMCEKRAIFKCMTIEEKEAFMNKLGGSWKLVLLFLLAGEICSRRGKFQARAGPDHSLAVTSSGTVYSFGLNCSGQLGHGTLDIEYRPRVIRSLQGVRIIQATAGNARTILISDCGLVYACGKNAFHSSEDGVEGINSVTSPKPVDSLKGIFVVQAAIGHLYTAVLSREGRVYTFSWAKLPRPLLGPLEDIPVVQIAAGACCLLALACLPSGMSVYSVACGLGVELWHGSTNKKQPRLIERFQALNFEPIEIAAGAWHAAAVARDGRICTWGWGMYGCLGHGNEDVQYVPTVVETLSNIKAVHVTAGYCTTFVVSEDGDVYSFGWAGSSNLGHSNEANEPENVHPNVLFPELVTSLKQLNERVVEISVSNSIRFLSHTLALTESGKLYAFGTGRTGQLGIQLVNQKTEYEKPQLVDIDLS